MITGYWQALSRILIIVIKVFSPLDQKNKHPFSGLSLPSLPKGAGAETFHSDDAVLWFLIGEFF